MNTYVGRFQLGNSNIHQELLKLVIKKACNFAKAVHGGVIQHGFVLIKLFVT